MNITERDAFYKLVSDVYSFYGKDASTFALNVWWQAMQHYDLAAINDAMGRHSVNPDSGQFLPKPADVVKMLEGSTLVSAVLAWTKVDQGVRLVGTYATVVFDDEMIHRVIADMGGWPQLGRKKIDEWPFVAKEFQTRYRGYKMRRATGAYPAQLIGMLDQQNSDRGFRSQVPVFIGDITKAKQVLQLGSSESLLAITQTHAIPDLLRGSTAALEAEAERLEDIL